MHVVTVERFHCGLRVEISMLIRFVLICLSLAFYENEADLSENPKSGSCNVALW